MKPETLNKLYNRSGFKMLPEHAQLQCYCYSFEQAINSVDITQALTSSDHAAYWAQIGQIIDLIEDCIETNDIPDIILDSLWWYSLEQINIAKFKIDEFIKEGEIVQ